MPEEGSPEGRWPWAPHARVGIPGGTAAVGTPRGDGGRKMCSGNRKTEKLAINYPKRTSPCPWGVLPVANL